MNKRRLVAIIFVIVAIVFGILFYREISFPAGLSDYFNKAYYNQFGPLAICVELLVAGYYLLVKHSKANFTLALFGFTAILDPIFNIVGLFHSIIPLHATIVFAVCAVIALWIAFSNAFNMGRISLTGALMSFILGNLVELFFNYL